MARRKKIIVKSLRVVINGNLREMSFNADAPFDYVIRAALHETGYTVPVSGEWELRDESGQLLDRAQSVSAVANDAKLFLNLPVGVGG